MAMPTEMELSDLFASAVHDIKNSLGVAVNTLEELDDASADCNEGVRRRIAQLNYEMRRANNVLVQLLTIYKAEARTYPVSPSYEVIADLLDELLLYQEPTARHRGVAIGTRCPEQLCWFVDRELAVGLVGNAVNNALRYARERVEVTAEQSGEWLEIRIEDDGAGFPEAMLGSSGGYAVRHPGGTDFMTGSTRLGLYFAHLAAQMHTNKGRVGETRIENGGSLGGGTLIVRLP